MARSNAATLRSHLELALDMYPDTQTQDAIEDVLLTLGRQYHLSRFIPKCEYAGLFLYLIADREYSNLALARRELLEAAAGLVLTPDEREIFANLGYDDRQSLTGRPHSDDIVGIGGSCNAEVSDEDLPPFMRTDSVMRLLGIGADAIPGDVIPPGAHVQAQAAAVYSG